jgi:flavin reductase (DIM6/NTAB) family NADH-FMN oxidoreductase RutF
MLVGISLSKVARMTTFLRTSQRYGVSVLSCAQEHIARYFSGEVGLPVPAFEWISIPHETDELFPMIPGALASLVGAITQVVETGDQSP